jgi:hypothetical protein
MGAVLPEGKPAEAFSETDLIPHTASPIVSGRNYVYCCTFQLAWNHLRDGYSKGMPVILEGDPELARALNASTFPSDALSKYSYVAYGGLRSNDTLETLRSELARKFPAEKSEALDSAEPGQPGDILAFAYLAKSLPFGTPYEVLPQPLRFRSPAGETDVKCFGIERYSYKQQASKQASQVTIASYKNRDDFVLRLATRKRDEIILAKVPPEKTLAATIDAVQRRIIGGSVRGSPRLMMDDRMSIPRLSIGINRRFTELVGRGMGDPFYYIRDALQLVRFRLDETGAVLISEALIVGENGYQHDPEKERDFVFDRPFLIFLIEPKAAQPYFAAWIENSELMEPAR